MTLLDTLALAASALAAVVGLVVAAHAYSGYRRHGSERMRALAVGVLFIAVVPFAVTRPVAVTVGLTDARALVVALASHTAGLVAIYRSLD